MSQVIHILFQITLTIIYLGDVFFVSSHSQ